jgi:hypothetical protein
MIIFQQITGDVNLDLLLVATGLCGTPGVIAAANLLRGNNATPDTQGQSSLPPASQSPERSSSS